MRIIGIDENGLGPALGPLVVTGVSFSAPSYDREELFGLAGPDLPASDSKALFAPRRLAAAEDAVLRWLDVFGIAADDTSALADALVLSRPWPAPCPAPLPAPCRAAALPLPRAGGRRPQGRTLAVWDRFDRLGIAPGRIAAHALCAGAFNAALDEVGGNKLRLDFALMMRVARALTSGENGALVLCGKVGGTAAYARWLEAEGLEIAEILCEGRDESAYEIRGLGRVRFLRDGDASHLPIALASMVGKYLRELEMERLNRALGRAPGRMASGYRDPVTRRFVGETATLRAALGVPDGCFLRRA
jgi:ribonuclease HII